jgi:NADPH:quinone reductase-like Zn-dependent oxidoreductase
MKAVLVERAGGDIKVVEDFDKPTPGPGQLLARPLYIALQPVYVL